MFTTTLTLARRAFSPRGGERRAAPLWRAMLLALCLGFTLLPLHAQNAAAPAAPAAPDAPAAPPLTGQVNILMVRDFASGKLVSDLEALNPISEASFDPSSTKTKSLGTAAELWVRNAGIDGKWGFERYYQDKYIGREAKLTIPAADLGAGDHVINPGNHVFNISGDGKLTSSDPDIRITGDTVMLRLHRVTIFAVDSEQEGAPESRLVAASLGVFALPPKFVLDKTALPDINHPRDPRSPKADLEKQPLLNVLSHAESFYPLSIWLPANTEGQGYILYPSWQTFHLKPDGVAELGAGGGLLVPGLTVTPETVPDLTGPESVATAVVVPYRTFSGRISTNKGLTAGVGNVKVGPEMAFSATLAPVRFRAGVGEKPDDSFSLMVDTDFTKLPYKSFVADNAEDEASIRLMALEWPRPVFTRGTDATISLRLLQTPEHEMLKQPEARMAWSPYRPSSPSWREWTPVTVKSWTHDPVTGELIFVVPDVPFGFGVLQVGIFEAGTPGHLTQLSSEILCSVIEPGQTGTASFAANKGRNAFIVGEDIDLTLVLRSTAARQAGDRTVVLRHPDGSEERLTVPDDGNVWRARTLNISANRSAYLLPGAYELRVDGLPKGIVSVPYRFDVAARRASSEFIVAAPSKYTKPMNGLVPSHLGRGTPIDLDRAMATLAGIGYNRVDLMTYLTNHHIRTNTWREPLAAMDPRLPPPAAVFQPTPRDQLLNACARSGLVFSDVFLSYNDFALPRYIPGYTHASTRWFGREVQSMRHSPAYGGMMLYDEMYQAPVSGLVPGQQKIFAEIRARIATELLGESPAKIEEALQRFLARPKAQRDPKAFEQYKKYAYWQQHGWNDWIAPEARIGKDLAPWAKYGTYHRTFMGPGASDVTMHGYVPDVFKDLEIISHVHYADNSTCWVHIPMLAQVLRTGVGKQLFINLPATHEGGTHFDGQYQRLLAFGLLEQGVDGISNWGIPTSFDDDANPATLNSNETTRHLNQEILQPFGDVLRRSADGYRKIGIVSTFDQQVLDDFKEIGLSHQTEEIWVACWRLGYGAVFLREDNMTQPLDQFSVIFVPGIRFDGELSEPVLNGLKDAIAKGVKVVVERGSELDLPGVTHLDDWNLTNFFLGNYFATWEDDELTKVYESSQISTDYLRTKFLDWGIEPTARGHFQVGPTWRDGGDVDYLIMANYDDPAYNHAVKQIMAKPELEPLQVPARHGAVAYDLLARKELPLTDVAGPKNEAEKALTLDMTRVQGAIVAFLPRRVGGVSVTPTVANGGGVLRLTANLLDEAGAPFDSLFPTRIDLTVGGGATQTLYRTLGRDRIAELDLPATAAAQPVKLVVTELIAAHQADVAGLKTSARSGATLTLVPEATVDIPFPNEVKAFLADNKTVTIVAGTRVADGRAIASELAEKLKALGINSTIVNEAVAAHYPSGDTTQDDPMNDGYHTWRGGQEVIGPALVVDQPTIILGSTSTSTLMRGLSEFGFVTHQPFGAPGQSTDPSLQVAVRGLNWQFDTLCIIANDAAGLRTAVARLFEPIAPAAPAIAPVYAAAQAPVSGKAVASPAAVPPAISYMGNNETIESLKFDAAGNMYFTTWGHGKNLYSLKPDGTLRWARYLPEYGASHLTVTKDRVLAYTSAGARLYQLTLDGEPVSQVRLNMDPGSTHYEDTYNLSHINVSYLEKPRQLLHNMGDKMRLLDADTMKIVTEWDAENFEDKDVSDEVMHRELGAYALSPDGTKIAQLEGSYYFSKRGNIDEKVTDAHLVLRDMTGKLLAEHRNVSNFMGDISDGLRVTWSDDAAGPVVGGGSERWTFDAELNLTDYTRNFQGGIAFGGDRRLVRYGDRFIYIEGGSEKTVLEPMSIIPTVVVLSRDGKWIAALDEQGLLTMFATADGKVRARWSVPELGSTMSFSPDSASIILGSKRGRVQSWNLDGKVQWNTPLAPANDILTGELQLYDASYKDYTEQLWPVTRDQDGDLEKVVRMGENRLVNGDAEGTGGWSAGAEYVAPGHSGAKSLKVGDTMIGQEVTNYLGRHVTWVLEFQYRAVKPETKPKLLAGIRIDSRFPDSAARNFVADGQWRFGRLVVKDGEDCEKLAVGFKATGGEVLVDDVRFRRIRFPSVNHLLYEPLYNFKPVILTNPFFSNKYDPVGNTREEAPNRVLVNGLATGVMNLVESSFLQNGRLNEMSSKWYVQPNTNTPTLGITLKEPRWISMLVLYFNIYDSDNILPHFDIYVTDMTTRKEVLVASVRHNQQLFRIVKFPPIMAASLSVRMVNSMRRLRTITEVELYGPLSGAEGTSGFADAEGQNTWMGDFSRVDKRVKTLPTTYLAPVQNHPGYGANQELFNWSPPAGQVLASDDKFYVNRAQGFQEQVTYAEPNKPANLGRANGLGFSPYGTIYGGLLLRCGNDGRFYCISPDSGTTLWSAELGTRLFGSPVVIVEDVFVATTEGKLFQLDLANGSIMKETTLPGGVFGSLATDGTRLFMATDDGGLQCYNALDLKLLWTVPVAPDSDSTPAVDGGVVYFADQAGMAYAIDAVTGKPRWQTPLGQEFARCPVVGAKEVIFGTRRGTLTVLERATGKVRWQREAKSRFEYEPLIVDDKVLYVESGKVVLVPLAGGEPVPVQWFGKDRGEKADSAHDAAFGDPAFSLGWYKGALVHIGRQGEHDQQQMNYGWGVTGGTFQVLKPKPPPPPPAPADATTKPAEGGK